MVAPTWFHLKHRIGPILRGERDNRQYHRLFQFPGYVTGLKRLALLATSERVIAESADLAAVARERPGKLVVFSNRLTMNEETHFHEIIGRGLQVRDELRAITKPRHVPQPMARTYIALHVRMGDFSAPPSLDKLRAGAKNARIPLEWYCSMLTGVRARLGREVPAVVLSDGSDEALAPLLGLSAVTRSPRQSSVSDLLTMSEGGLLISSGSGFSMWGAYLGDLSRICYPGQRLVRVLAPANGADREPECESAQELPPQFLSLLTHLTATP
jgi:hypothetical protein